MNTSSNQEHVITRPDKVMLLDIQEIIKPNCLEVRKWRQERIPAIENLEKLSNTTDVAPILVEATFETFRAYRFGVAGYAESIFVKAPIPEVFMRLIDGILAAHNRKIKALDNEIKRLREEFHRQRMSIPEAYHDALYDKSYFDKDWGSDDDELQP